MSYPTVIKGLATVEAVEDTEHPNGAFELILSAPTEDRDGEIVDEGAFDPLPDHISMDIDHGMSVATTVGSGVPRYEDGLLKVSGTYASTELGQMTRTLVREGHIRTASVAFIPKLTTKAAASPDGKKHIQKAELLNGAFTPVPANKDALITASKTLQDIDAALKNSKRTASSTADAIEKARGLKSIVGSVEALQDRVMDALRDAYADRYGYWGWLRGVIPGEGGGVAVFQSSNLTPPEFYESISYQQSFTDDGSSVTLIGNAVEVDVMEIVVPDTDDTTSTSKAASGAAELKSSATSDASSADALEVEIGLRAAAIRAAAGAL